MVTRASVINMSFTCIVNMSCQHLHGSPATGAAAGRALASSRIFLVVCTVAAAPHQLNRPATLAGRFHKLVLHMTESVAHLVGPARIQDAGPVQLLEGIY